MPEHWLRRGLVLSLAGVIVAASLAVGPNAGGVLPVISGASPFLFPVCLALGAWWPRRWSIPILLVIAVAAVINQRYVNPLVLMLTFGPWLVGWIIRSRRAIATQLELRAAQLQVEQEIFAQESVRYERARIARELHDIVGHCVSVMVIQAAAGQRLAAGDPERASEALEHVAEAIAQAQAEMSRLVDLLADTAAVDLEVGLGLVEELVTRARATGLPVTCRFVGRSDVLDDVSAEAAYRVVQEALTNALKHAPGAAVSIESVEQDAALTISVVNAPPAAEYTSLHSIGGGNGLRGMRERVTACGGDIVVGPTDEGGWRVAVRLPAGNRRLAEAVS